MISEKDYEDLKKVIEKIIDRKFYISGWKELYWAMFGKGSSNRYYYFRQLSPRQQKVLTLRYGLKKGASPKTLEEIGEIFGVTKERIRQLEFVALEKLRAIYRKTYNQHSKAKRRLR